MIVHAINPTGSTFTTSPYPLGDLSLVLIKDETSRPKNTCYDKYFQEIDCRLKPLSLSLMSLS